MVWNSLEYQPNRSNYKKTSHWNASKKIHRPKNYKKIIIQSKPKSRKEKTTKKLSTRHQKCPFFHPQKRKKDAKTVWIFLCSILFSLRFKVSFSVDFSLLCGSFLVYFNSSRRKQKSLFKRLNFSILPWLTYAWRRWPHR